MKTTPLTVELLNDIQADWMALDCQAPEKEKRRVFARMDTIPKSHLSVSKDGTLANVMIQGCPCFASGLPLEQAKQWAKERDVQTQFAWQNCKWIAL